MAAQGYRYSADGVSTAAHWRSQRFGRAAIPFGTAAAAERKVYFFQRRKGAHDGVYLFIAVRGIDAAAQQGDARRSAGGSTRFTYTPWAISSRQKRNPSSFEPIITGTTGLMRGPGYTQFGEAVVQTVRVAHSFSRSSGWRAIFAAPCAPMRCWTATAKR